MTTVHLQSTDSSLTKQLCDKIETTQKEIAAWKKANVTTEDLEKELLNATEALGKLITYSRNALSASLAQDPPLFADLESELKTIITSGQSDGEIVKALSNLSSGDAATRQAVLTLIESDPTFFKELTSKATACSEDIISASSKKTTAPSAAFIRPQGIGSTVSAEFPEELTSTCVWIDDFSPRCWISYACFV